MFQAKIILYIPYYIHNRILSALNSFMMEVPTYRNQPIDLQSKSVDWFLYDRDLRYEKVNQYLNFPSDYEEELDSDESSGKDWSDLEEQAKRGN